MNGNPTLVPLRVSPEGGAQIIRVASVPSGHVYVRHLTADSRDGVRDGHDPAVVRLRDPDPDDPARSAVSRWWPPAMLEDGWVSEHADEFDVLHLQFGFDARTPDELRAFVAALRANGKPFVYTVHDLRNPHHLDRAEHDAQLDVLIPAADAVITLTPGAAAEIERRWGRQAVVLPHPHVVDIGTMERVGAERRARRAGAGDEPFRIGVHVKSLRASMNPLPVIETLVAAVRDEPGVILQIDGHSDVLTPGGARYDEHLAGYLREADERGDLDLRIHEFFTDDELWAYLAGLDVSVLPYRFGTHSGWLEACRDLGTAVIAPDCGYYREQGPVFEYHHDETGLGASTLVDAVRRARRAEPPEPAPVPERLAQRAAGAAAHDALYRGLLS